MDMEHIYMRIHFLHMKVNGIMVLNKVKEH